MAFIEQTDLERYVTADDLNQITEGNPAIMGGAINDAMEHVSEYLRQRYDMDVEFAKVAPNRHRSLLKHTIAVTLYFLCERIAFDQLPENRVVAYNNANQWLKDCGSGTIQPDLQKIADKESGISIRYGNTSNTKNNHW